MKKLEEKRKELEELRESNESAWNDYGSELCAGDMIRQERELEEEIRELEKNES